MTRVLFVCPNLGAGGAERHWSILLPLLRDRGLAVEGLTLDGRGPFYDSLEADGIAMRCAFTRSGRILTYVHAVSMLASHNADVIVSRGTSAEGLAAFAQVMRRRPWIVNWHHPPGLPLAKRRRVILRSVLRRADAVAAVGPSQLDELVTLGVARSSISVIHNATDFHGSRASREPARAALGIEPDDVAVLLVGRLEPQKRIDVFVDAMALAQRRDPRVVGLVAGAGPDAAALISRARESRADVRFLGRRDDMPNVFAAADVMCLTSDAEAAPYSVLEAMASALPVVGTRVGDMAELVVAGSTGILVEPRSPAAVADALCGLATEPARRLRMGAAGLARQREHFSPAAMADRYAELLRSVAAHGRRP